MSIRPKTTPDDEARGQTVSDGQQAFEALCQSTPGFPALWADVQQLQDHEARAAIGVARVLIGPASLLSLARSRGWAPGRIAVLAKQHRAIERAADAEHRLVCQQRSARAEVAAGGHPPPAWFRDPEQRRARVQA